MAECIVEVSRIEAVRPHPNADALELSQIKGWQCIVPIGKYQAGDLVTYIPIDSLIPTEHSDRWGITKYLSFKPENPDKGRVRCARLRGEPSFGVIVDREDPTWTEGQDVKAYYGIEKYIPPFKTSAGDAAPHHPLFGEYTDIENLRNYPDVFTPGETVSITEKVHGTNCRVGCIEGELMAGSMSVRRRRPEEESTWASNTYWFPLTIPAVRRLVEELGAKHKQVIVYGEVFGAKVQELAYGVTGRVDFRAFDILVDGKFLNPVAFSTLCKSFGVETVPVLHVGPFCLEQVKALASGNTTLCANQIKEGVVVKPMEERTHPKVGRVAMKYIGDQYLFSKAAERDTHDV